MAEYVQIAPGVEGFAYVDPSTDELVTLDSDVLGAGQEHLHPATPDDIAGAQRGFKAQGFGQKAIGLGEQAVGGATFGADAFGLDALKTPDAAARAQVLEAQNPLLKGAARIAGTLLPALATGGALGAGLGAAGVGARAAGALTFGAEELVQSAAYEMADAAETDRNIEVGNIAQGLIEGAAFLGAGRFAGKLFRRGEEALTDISGSPTQALARAQTASATAADVERATPTWAEAKHYAENADEIRGEINQLGAEAGNKLFGRNGSASRAHNVAEKKADIFGKMKDADSVEIASSLERYADEAEQLSAKMASPQAQKTIKQHADRMRGLAAGADVEDAAIAVDEYKKHLDVWREQLGQVKATSRMTAKANVAAIDEVLEPVRKDLENSKVWGSAWADKQAKENALWSGPDGIINARSRWQDKLMEREAGAAGRARQGLQSVPVFRMKGDMADQILGMSKHDRDYILKNMRQDIAKTEEMGQIKRTLGGTETRQAVDESLADLAEFKDAVEEIARVSRTVDVHGARLKKLGVGAGKNVAEEVLDTVAVGGAVGGGLPGAAAGVAVRGLKKLALDAMTPIAKESKALTIGALRASIARRNAMRRGGGDVEIRTPAPAATEAETKGKIVDFYGHPEADQRALGEMAAAAETLGAGKGVEDLNALPLDAADRAGVDGIKRRKDFQESGNVHTDNHGSSPGGLPQFTLEGGKLYMGNGRHRWTAAQEMGKDYIIGRIRKTLPNGDEIAYIGPIRVSKPPAAGVRRETVGGFGRARLDSGAVGDALKNGGRKVVKAGKETAIEAAGGTALAAGALGVAHMAAETQAIKELDQHSKDTTERAMLKLGSEDAQVMPLVNIADRFRGEHKDLTTAYQVRMADLKRLVNDPQEFIARSTAAFQPLADAGHPELASKLITRMMVGARYLLENAPPSISVSMFRPDGGTPDEIAILQYAPIWEAVWRPMDTVRDFASRRASPSAIKAIREVHPDVYARMLGEVFKTLAPSGPATDFETKRYLDCVLGLGGAMGRSFSPQMSDLLATARQDTKQTQASLGGENNIAPATATVGFSKGPTAIR